MGTAVRVRRENTEHDDTDTANSGYEDSDIETTTGEEAHPALADNLPLMPPPPPPADNGDTASQGDAGNNAADTTDSAESDNASDVDDTVTIQKVSLSDIL